MGWNADRITKNLDAVIVGMHAHADNPEWLKAKDLGLKIYSYPEFIYEHSKNKTRVAIAGSHGKTTITGMVMHVLKQNNKAFDFLVGAKLEGFEYSVQLSDAPIMIIEADEYPDSQETKIPKFLYYKPQIACISGIAWDHINVFPTYDIYRSQFEQYLTNMQAGVSLYYNNEDTEVQKVVSSSAKHLHAVPYDMPSFTYEDGTAIIHTEAGSVTVSVFGRHNLLNMQAALAVCAELGISHADFYTHIADFTGAARRLEKVFESENLVTYRDFAHAPSKLKATLDAVKEALPGHTVIACFELHTFSSLNEEFLKEYAHSMDAADVALVYFSHHALSLKGLPALQTDIVKGYFKREDILVIDNKSLLETTVKNCISTATPPVCLLMMSSGTFDGIDWNTVSSQLSL